MRTNKAADWLELETALLKSVASSITIGPEGQGLHGQNFAGLLTGHSVASMKINVNLGWQRRMAPSPKSPSSTTYTTCRKATTRHLRR